MLKVPETAVMAISLVANSRWMLSQRSVAMLSGMETDPQLSKLNCTQVRP